MTVKFFSKSLASKSGSRLKTRSLHRMSLWVMTVISSLGLAFVPIASTFAASSWDTAVRPTSTLTITDEYGQHAVDVTNSYASLMSELCPTAYSSLVSTMSNANGRWSIIENEWYGSKTVGIGWIVDANAETEFTQVGSDYQVLTPRSHYATLTVDTYSTQEPVCYSGTTTWDMAIGQSELPGLKVFFSNYPVDKPDYEGAAIPNGTATDYDKDGLSDHVESSMFTNREDVFCKTSVTPHVCAYPDPLVKDIYVEVDWMVNGTDSFKPSSTQLGMAVDGLNDNGYNVHMDAGEYGGGNVLPSYTQYLPFSHDASPVGFFDLKNGNVSESISPNFNPNRQGIWRYLISGYGFDEEQGSSGASYAGSDNVFISYGVIEDDPVGFEYTDLDTAIAGTIVHELGHGLCLSEVKRFTYQSSACIYSGVDAEVSNTYDSSMNYNLQFLQYKLSDGSNWFGDHDDWGAIDSQGIADYTEWTPSEIVSPGATAAQVQEAVKKGTYGKVVRGNNVYDLRHGKVYDSKENKVYNINKEGQKVGVSKDQDKWKGQLSKLLK